MAAALDVRAASPTDLVRRRLADADAAVIMKIGKNFQKIRDVFDELNLIDLIQDMDLADERVVDLRGTKFTAKEVAAQLSGMGIKKFGNQNFATCRIDDTTVSCMRTG